MRFTEEQLENARSVGILEWMQKNEPHNLVSNGNNEFRHKEHSSFIISNGKWNWINGEMGGYSALDYLVKYRGEKFVDAVKRLNADIGWSVQKSQAMTDEPKNSHATPRVPKPFKLPEKHENNNRAIEYLKSRDISMETIQKCIDAGILYQSKNIPNCVFVGHDDGKPKYAYQRGIVGEFKGEARGSKKIYGFCMQPDSENGEKTIAVFESPLDALAHKSFMEIAQRSDNVQWDGYRLSLGGTTSGALERFLENNPQIEKVYFCLDNDDAGDKATDRMIRELKTSPKHCDKQTIKAPPKFGKDYSDTLTIVKQKFDSIQKSQEQSLRPERHEDTR